MAARYLIRFDDLCPTMNWDVWDRIEQVLMRHDVKPIVAVVPDNHDPKLMIAPPRADFWERVARWQDAGWAIALHGHRHLYETTASGLLGINDYSEFAGLSYQAQRDKLNRALTIFARHKIRVDLWVAPAHSFDATTVQALADTGISVISDGFYSRPVRLLGATWVPQQMWQFRPMPFGLWTVCFHHNHLSADALWRLAQNVAHYEPRMLSLQQVLAEYRIDDCTLLDTALSHAWLAALRLKRRAW